MKYFKISALLALVVLNFIAASNVFSCTEIMLNYNNQYVTGRNFDWPVNFKYAFIVINQWAYTDNQMTAMSMISNYLGLQNMAA